MGVCNIQESLFDVFRPGLSRKIVSSIKRIPAGDMAPGISAIFANLVVQFQRCSTIVLASPRL